MSTTTTNNGWTIPASTDYVKDGATAIATLGSGIDTSVAKGLLAWQDYSASVTFTNFTKGSSTVTARYCQVGKTVYYYVSVAMGSGSSMGTSPTISLPVTGVSQQTGIQSASLSAGGGTTYVGWVRMTSTTALAMGYFDASAAALTRGAINSTTPATWGTTGAFSFLYIYEAA